MGCVKSHIKAKVKNVTVSEKVFLQKKKVLEKAQTGEVRTSRHSPSFPRLSTEIEKGSKRCRDYTVFKHQAIGSVLHP